MCGRFTLGLPDDAVAEYFAATIEQPFGRSYNIAPTQQIPVVLLDGGRRVVRLMRWGLVPAWAREPLDAKLINARAETVADKPSFRAAFARRRGLIPADGFYEWKAAGKVKQPHHIRRRDGGLLAFAALWESWRPPGGAFVLSCAIITVPPNALMASIHDRMPAILPPDQLATWLDPATPRDTLRALLAPLGGESLEAYPVSRRVNVPGETGPECIERLPGT